MQTVQTRWDSQRLDAGCYSCGEISPFTPSAKRELLNQTMTITTLSEL